MPIGNGDLAANVWVEPTGDLLFYISKSDAWSGNGRLLKLGRVRVKTDPPLYTDGATFKQELDLETSSIRVQSAIGNRQSAILFWVDANRPVINVELDSSVPVKATASLELWRTARRELKGHELHSARGLMGGRGGGGPRVFVEPDIILPAKGNALRWCHRNGKSIYPDVFEKQHLAHLLEQYSDPLLYRTFGGILRGEGMVSRDDKTLVSKAPAERVHLTLHSLTAQTDTLEEWERQLEEAARNRQEVSLAKARSAHEAWWQQFWGRSWIRINEGQARGTSAVMVPDNDYAVHVGMDTSRGNPFVGEIGRVSIAGTALSPAAIKQLASTPSGDAVDLPGAVYSGIPGKRGPLADSSAWSFTKGLTVEAWIKPGRLPHGGGRILDKCRVAKAEGFVLDTFPGNSLRLITAARTVTHKANLPRDKWSHVAATADPVTGEIALFVNGRNAGGGKEMTDAASVTRAYTLQRWIQACAGRGQYPIKFNGSLFTVAGNDKGSWNADYRRWGGCYWFQNTRLPYWAMINSGDYDQMEPFWRMYRHALPLLKERTKAYYDHDGAFCSETMYFWGMYANTDFGWNNKGVHTVNPYVRYYWDSGNELSQMMLEYYAHTQDERFAQETLLPVADAVVTFYDQHYKRNAEGKVHFSPAMSLETWHSAEDPLPIIVGLRTVLTGLLALPEALTTTEQRERWRRLRGELPELPMAEQDGKKWLLPARKYSNKANVENPELYAVFPYRAYTMHKPDLEVAMETWRRRRVKSAFGWNQNPIKAALLGLTDEARAYVIGSSKRKDPGSRFPAFWAAHYDWIPDQDHGSVIMIALQRMLMQCDPSTGSGQEAGKIYLLPAWPREWDVDFKLHAPMQTIVEGRVEGGEIVDLTVAPESRRKDIVVCDQ